MKNLKKTSFLSLVIIYLGMTMSAQAMLPEKRKCGIVYDSCFCFPYEK